MSSFKDTDFNNWEELNTFVETLELKLEKANERIRVLELELSEEEKLADLVDEYEYGKIPICDIENLARKLRYKRQAKRVEVEDE